MDVIFELTILKNSCYLGSRSFLQKHVDYIIVGGGISGCVPSYTLMKYGASVVVFDLPRTTSALLQQQTMESRCPKAYEEGLEGDDMMDELHAVYPDMERWT